MINRMKTSDKGRAFITQNEGKEYHVYEDVAGLKTIGVGHLLTKDELSSGKIMILGIPVKYADGLQDFDIDRLLMQDLASAEGAVNFGVEVPLTQYQFDALVDFVFNVGRVAFLNSTLRKVINAEQFAQVPIQLKRWNKAGGKTVQGLVNRREAEIAMFEGGYER